VFNDPPLHTHVRQAIGDALSPRAVIAMEPALRALVDSLLDELAARGTFDCMEHFASVIPVEVIGNLLRVPRAERGPLRGWSAAILGALEFGLDDAGLAAGNRAIEEFIAYLRQLIAERRRALSADDDDILSRLIQWERNGERLSEHQLYHQCIFLLNAGHETTTNLIGNALNALLDHPGELARLRANPGLLPGAVDEFLRYESPVQLGNRTVIAPTELSGVALPAGATLTLCIGAANRDPRVFSDPDRLDVGRDASAHLAFGSGIHTCAGLHIARLEGRVALQGFLDRFARIARAGPPVRAPRARFRGLERLPLTVV
jgi:cytochrome P450